MRPAGWASTTAYVSHILMGSFYLYHWLNILGIGAFVSSLGIGYLFSPTMLIVGGPLGIVILISGLVIGRYAKRLRKYQARNPDFDIQNLEITYSILSATKYVVGRKVLATVLHDSIAEYKQGLTWTGLETPVPMLERSKQQIEIAPRTHGPNLECKAKLEPLPTKGSSVEIIYWLDLPDPTQLAQQHYAITIHDWVRKTLMIRITFEQGVNIDQFRKKIFMSPAAQTPVWQEDVLPAFGSREILWTVKRPRPNHRYCISWDR